ncbi:MAG TPA: alkaline phosphatase family protein [Thermoleophilaceae bacterium]
MTRMQLNIVAAVSVVATIAVLAGGVGAAGDNSALAKALARQLSRTVTLPGSPAGPAARDLGADGASTIDSAADEPAPAAPNDDGGGFADASGGGTQPTNGNIADEPPADSPPSRIKHVFVIALAGHGFDATFGPSSPAPYLTGQLRPKGALLTNYSSLGHGDLADLLALAGGQPPNADTSAGCPTYRDFPPMTKPKKSGEIVADGCVYPNTVTSLSDQVTSSGGSWRAYIEDLDQGPDGKSSCRHPASDAADDTTRARPGDGYATRHNPFVYFHSLLDLGSCDANDVALGGLESDLRTAKDTPNLAFIAPNLCHDGTESPCADGSPGGIPAADAFLAEWAPKILDSPAYRKDGLLVITFADSPDQTTPVGTLLVSQYADAGITNDAAWDPYSLLRSLEDLLGLDALARAAEADSFANTVLARALPDY